MSGIPLGPLLPKAAHLILIRAFKTREAFCDEKSGERTTGQIKRKYKVLTKIFPEMGIYIFVLSTSESTATSRYTTVRVQQHEWEDRVPFYLEGTSYLDAKKIQPHNETELLHKKREDRKS